MECPVEIAWYNWLPGVIALVLIGLELLRGCYSQREMPANDKLITSPDAHHAHHGFGANGAPMGNFAPTVIFWDVVFGTAHFPHERQEKVGIADDPILPWYRQLWWPLFRTKADFSP